MLDALSAEIFKLRRHKAIWFLVWIYPILFAIALVILTGVGMARVVPVHPESLAKWLDDTALVWRIPSSSFGRYLIAGFVALAFAGEYGWNTWKLIVPHRSRMALIAAKYGAVLILFFASFVLTALISIAGAWTSDVLAHQVVPAGITATGLLRVHGAAALAALPPFLVTVGYASLAAVLTRSTIAALIIALVAITVEQLVFGLAPMLSPEFPRLVAILYHALPGYHLANLASWIEHGAALRIEFPGGSTVALAWPVSLATIGAWLLVLIGGTFAAFARQDIN
jgi:ABC-2 type transport system permease protein